MSHFVRGFHVDVDEIAAVLGQGIDGGLRLALKIRVDGAGSTRNLINLHPCAHGNALEQVYGGHHSALQTGFLSKVLQGGLCSRAPEPEGIGLVFAFGRPLQIQGVSVQNVKALFHHGAQLGFLRKIGADDVGQMVVRRLQLGHGAIFPDGDVAVAGAGVVLKFVAVEGFPNGVHQNVRVGGGDFAGAVVKNGLFGVGFFLGQRYDVAAQNDVRRLHGDAYAQCFQRRSSGVTDGGIVAQNGQVGHVAAGSHPGGDVLHHAHFSFGRQFIHYGRFRAGKGCFSAQCVDGFVGHAVPQNHNVFHSLSPFIQRPCCGDKCILFL